MGLETFKSAWVQYSFAKRRQDWNLIFNPFINNFYALWRVIDLLLIGELPWLSNDVLF